MLTLFHASGKVNMFLNFYDRSVRFHSRLDMKVINFHTAINQFYKIRPGFKECIRNMEFYTIISIPT